MTIQQRQPGYRQKAMYYFSALIIMFFTISPSVNAEEIVPALPVETVTTEPDPLPDQLPPAIEPTILLVTLPAAPEPPAPVPGPQEPTGVDANEYVYNEATGLWENDKYSWNPQTNQTSPKSEQSYSYNPQTGHWDTTEWIYDAPSGTYIPNIITVIAPPDGATTIGYPETANNPSTTTFAKDGNNLAADSGGSKVSPSSYTQETDKHSIDSSSQSTGVFDMFFNAVISNNINSKAFTGDALVAMNTLAGNALSGDASSIANVFNLLQSVWNLGLNGSLLNMFTQNLFGNIIGDLWLDPGQPDGSLKSNTNNDLTVNATENTAIENVISLEAVSGDATVTKNTQAGDATTGTATVIANIINAINSSIVSGGTFLGMLNIYGSLDGDILMPDELISSLLASNTLGSLDTSLINNTDVLGNFTNNSSTTNNVSATAGSGNAEVLQNTTAGHATTGDAETNVTVLNLTGRQVVGANALLVFVNVMGTWVGMIVDAPAGSTSAALGGDITTNNSLKLNATSNQSINNDINVTAKSGDVLVSENTRAGDATSGDAYAAVNILNLNGSQFALTDWFGILFINVFGTWNGSFGVDTLAGNTLPEALTTDGRGAGGASVAAGSERIGQVGLEQIKAFSFVPQADGTYELESSDQGVAALASAQVLDSTALIPTSPETQRKSNPEENGPLQSLAQRDWSLALITTTIGLSLLGAERVATRRTRGDL